MKPPVVLVFGEDDHDRRVLVTLIEALAPKAPRAEQRRNPLILVKGREAAKRKKNAMDVAREVARERRIREVPFIVAHQDCDALEPAHIALSLEIESALGDAGIRAIAATPAWEMEAWLYLWPDACASVVSGWRRPARDGANVGLIENAKEALRRDLRDPKRKTRDYEESDSVRIVKRAVEMGVLTSSKQRSASFDRFRQRLTEVASGR